MGAPIDDAVALMDSRQDQGALHTSVQDENIVHALLKHEIGCCGRHLTTMIIQDDDAVWLLVSEGQYLRREGIEGPRQEADRIAPCCIMKVLSETRESPAYILPAYRQS